MSAGRYGFYRLGVVVVMSSLELLSLQELTEARSLSSAGRLSLSESERESLSSELERRWSELRALCCVGGPAAECLSSLFAMRRAECLSAK